MEDSGITEPNEPVQLVEVHGNLLPKASGKFVDNWEDWQVETLKTHWGKDNNTARDIGCLVGKTKNAVIGKARRIGLEQLKSSPLRWRRGLFKLTEPKVEVVKEQPVLRRKPKAPSFYAEAVALENSSPVSIMELGPRSCRSIIGTGADGLAMYCNNQTFWDEGTQRFKSFCAAHAKLYYAERPYRGRRY